MRLEASGLADRFEEVNRKAVEIAQAATKGMDVLVAGSIGPTGHMLAPLGTLQGEDAEADFMAQAKLLVEAGVDLLVIETQFDLNEATAAIRGVRAVDAQIPLICSFSYDRGTRTMMGVKPEDMVAAIGALDCGRVGDQLWPQPG